MYIISLEKKNKKEPTGEINQKTGKKIYRDVPGKFEYWLGRFIVKNGAGRKMYYKILLYRKTVKRPGFPYGNTPYRE